MSGVSDSGWILRFLRSARSSKNPLRYSVHGRRVRDVTVDGSFRKQGRSDLHLARKRSPEQNGHRTGVRGIRAKVRGRFGASGAG